MLPDYYAPRSAPLLHQVEALEAGWQREAFAYLMEMGTGKSRTDIDDFCLNYRAGRITAALLLAPKPVYTNWTREDEENPGELSRWLWESAAPGALVHTYRAGRGSRDAEALHRLMSRGSGLRILAMNVEALATTRDAYDIAAEFCRTHVVHATLDESTVAKNPTAQRTKLLIKLARLAAIRRILSGSPVTRSQSDLWAQFEFLSPGRNLLGFSSFRVFQTRYCQMREMEVAGRRIRTEVGPQNTEELAARVARHSYRRRKSECLDLEPKQFFRWEVELTAEQRRVYTELRRTAMAEVGGGEVTTQIVMTQLMRMHQVVCGHVTTDDGVSHELPTQRMDALREIVEGTEEQMVIWCAYLPDARRVTAWLRGTYGEGSVGVWTGERTLAQREADEGDFQAGRRRFMVATQSAGARGRTWTAGTCVVYYANADDLDLREQSEDRTHRMGTVGAVTYWDIVCPGTVDEKIIRSLRGKKDVKRAVMRDGLEAWI